MRLIALLLASLPAAFATSGGPDAGGIVFTDSNEPSGPSHRWLDTSGGDRWFLDDDDTVSVVLPFEYGFYGQTYSTATVSSNGVLFFEGASGDAVGACPSPTGASWTGVAAFWDDLAASYVETHTLGAWPNRTFVVSWPAATPVGQSGVGRFQVWLLEGRGEAVVVLDDLSFGGAADGGASAFVGVAGASAGSPYACEAVTADSTTVWFGDESARPARSVVGSDDLDDPWIGATVYEESGTGLLTGDLDDDGYDDLLVAAKDFGAGVAWLIGSPDTPDVLSNADASFEGAGDGDAFGAAMAAGDTDGDGLPELAFGAPDADIGASSTGAVFVYTGGSLVGSFDTIDSSATVIGDAALRNRIGEAVRLDVDLNADGYNDLIVAAPHADDIAADAGKVYVFYSGVAGFSGLLPSASADASFSGEVAVDLFGTAIVGADLDDDGAVTDLFVGAPGASNAVGSDGGAVYLVTSGSWSGNNPAAGLPCAVYGASLGGAFGSSILAQDLDGSGVLDLVVGSPTQDGVGVDAGGVAMLMDLDFADCGSSSASFDLRLEGSAGSQQFGSALAVGDVDDDGQLDLVASAPNYSSTTTASGGAAAIWLGLPSVSGSITSASIRLQSDSSGAAFGQSLAFAHNPDGPPELVVAAPYTTTNFTRDGAVYQYQYAENFEDADGDGFVTTSSGGNDCDDTDSSAYPGGDDTDGDSIDGDCDGWVDGVIAVRLDEAGWSWDLGTIGGSTWDTYDFESYSDGASIGTYGNISFGGTLFAETDIYGSLPVGALGAQLIPGTTNTLTLSFASPVDALAFQLLDPDAGFTLVATDAGGGQVAGYSFSASADDRSGGDFYGFVFIEPVNTVTLTADSTDGFGLDDLLLVDATRTDRDLDGYTDAEGDCDDADLNLNPDMVEILGDGLDNDCDGLVDSGPADVFTDSLAWTDAAALDAEIINFETRLSGELVEDQYRSLGAIFDGGLVVSDDVDGSAPNGSLGALATAESSTLLFVEVQPSYSFVILDGDGTFTIDAYEDFDLQYSMVVTASGAQTFVGVVGTLPVDELRITGPEGDVWGIDDLTINVIGRDDADGDGQTEPTDCDDEDAATYAGAPDTWYDGLDSDCAENDDFDQDADGFALGDDCDDGSSAVSPAALEVFYDGLDQDCDGRSDFDADFDGQDSRDFGGFDCDDGDDAVYDGATEIWYDGVDGDCGEDDDFDQDGDGVGYYGGTTGEDCNDTDSAVVPGGLEVPYNGIDDDCDETTSDVDLDRDGHLAVAIGGDDCDDQDPSIYLDAPGEACYDGIDIDCDGVNDYDCDEDGFVAAEYDGDDCDDVDPAVSPAAAELCYDGFDQNCDAWSDFDCDTDGYDALAYGGLDCEDALGGINPGAADYPYDGVDHDCDGAEEFDEDGDGQTADWYGGADCDDTRGDVYVGATDDCYDGVDADCAADTDYDCDGDGYLSDDFGGDDCDDADATVSPIGTEIAEDGVDQDCDLADLIVTDLDDDGFATPDDCDDSRADVYPGAPDAVYDGTDADCAGDGDFDADLDGDDAEAWGGGDCDDQNAAVGSFVTTDDCGAGDEDCDGTEDEDCVTAGDSEPSDDSEAPTDSDPGDSNPDQRDTAESWRPAGETPTEAEKIPLDEGCGCDSGGAASGAGLMLGLAALLRRRR